MARVLSGEASSAEVEELQLYIQLDPELGHHFELLKNIWLTKASAGADQSQSIDELLLRARSLEKQTVISRPADKPMHKWLAAAAILLLVFSAWRLLRPSSSFDAVTANQFSYNDSLVTRNGNRRLEVLPDGSKVWLNAGSKLSYVKEFDGPVRDVALEGEAYFDVAHLPERPFIVHVGDVQVKVLGTLFNVKSYPADSSVTTTLVHGSVSISRSSEPDEVLYTLSPREKVTVQKYASSERSSSVAEAKLEIPVIEKLDSVYQIAELPETAWVYNRLVFRAENFEALAAKMQRWFNVEIHFADDAVKQLSFSGSFENENITQALKALQDVAPFQFSLENKQVTISSLH